MYLFLETFRITGGRIENPEGHRARIAATAARFWPGAEEPEWARRLESLLPGGACPSFDPQAVYKGRLLWGTAESPEPRAALEITPYRIKPVTRLVVVRPDPFPDYRFKYAERSSLMALTESLHNDAEALILDPDGRITDTTYSNLLFSDGKILLTPATPLLPGTRRAALLEAGIIHEDIFTLKDLKSFKTVHLINALLPPGTLTLPINCIFF